MSKNLNDIIYSRQMKEYQNHAYVCKHCGRKNLMPYHVDKRVCSWCGSMVYKDDKNFFKDKLRQHLNKRED